MTFTHLLTKQIIISRLTTVSGDKKAYVTTTGAIASEIQPLSPAKTQIYDGVVGKTFIIFAGPTQDIQEGDKLRNNSTGKIYKVKNGGVSRRTQGSIDYLSIVVEEVS